jgi:hypothetical protein
MNTDSWGDPLGETRRMNSLPRWNSLTQCLNTCLLDLPPGQPLMPSAQSFFNAATNQLTNVSYDAAGNQTVF